ncbi:Dbl homology domain-containing protein [Blastocladiella britannica]|nr:Dbl homology domain-containing protein [Blastocladiella britannica]
MITHQKQTLADSATHLADSPDLAESPRKDERSPNEANTAVANLQRRMQSILREITCTEETYLAGLQDLMSLYYEPLGIAADQSAPNSVSDPDFCTSTIGNLNELISISNCLIKALGASDGLPEHMFIDSDDWTRLFDAWITLLPRMEAAFADFSRRFHVVTCLASKLMSSHSAFAAIVNKAANGSVTRTLHALIILPIQRLPRYVLLLQALASTVSKLETPFMASGSFHVVLEGVLAATSAMNNATAAAGGNSAASAATLLGLQRRLIGNRQSLVNPGRILHRAGLLTKASRQRNDARAVAICSDVLIVGSPLGWGAGHPLTNHASSEDPWTGPVLLHHWLPLSLIVDVTPCQSVPNGLSVRTKVKSFVLIPDSRKEQQAWLSAFATAISEYKVPPVNALHLQPPLHPNRTRAPTLRVPAAPFWEPAESAQSACPFCEQKWHSLLRRRHHCRACGAVACGDCCGGARATELSITAATDSTVARVCPPCFTKAVTQKCLNEPPQGDDRTFAASSCTVGWTAWSENESADRIPWDI